MQNLMEDWWLGLLASSSDYIPSTYVSVKPYTIGITRVLRSILTVTDPELSGFWTGLNPIQTKSSSFSFSRQVCAAPRTSCHYSPAFQLFIVCFGGDRTNIDWATNSTEQLTKLFNSNVCTLYIQKKDSVWINRKKINNKLKEVVD